MADPIIAVVTFTEPDKQGHDRQYASHGYNVDTGKTVILPQERIETLAKIHPDFGWVLK